jgi:hypothetical protein
MMADIGWLASEAKAIHGIFYSFFYLLVTMLLLLGVVLEYFKIPMGAMPSFGQLVGRVFIALSGHYECDCRCHRRHCWTIGRHESI